MSLTRNRVFALFLCFLVFVFVALSLQTTACAVAVVDDVALAILASIMVGSGLVFASQGELYNAAESFAASDVGIGQALQNLTAAAANGVLTLSSATQDAFTTVTAALGTFFAGQTITATDYLNTIYLNHAGTTANIVVTNLSKMASYPYSPAITSAMCPYSISDTASLSLTDGTYYTFEAVLSGSSYYVSGVHYSATGGVLTTTAFSSFPATGTWGLQYALNRSGVATIFLSVYDPSYSSNTLGAEVCAVSSVATGNPSVDYPVQKTTDTDADAVTMAALVAAIAAAIAAGNTLTLPYDTTFDPTANPDVAVPWTQKDIIGNIPISTPVTPPSVPADLEPLELPDVTELFPFCIPFDLIHLVGVLAADPVAPQFHWSIPVPASSIVWNIGIDFNQFSGVAQVARVGETLVFIAGLIMATRNLIKG